MYKNFDPHKRYFYAVAMALIVSGSAIFALGSVELVTNLLGQSTFGAPVQKIIGGLTVIALGYIHLELELQRTKK